MLKKLGQKEVLDMIVEAMREYYSPVMRVEVDFEECKITNVNISQDTIIERLKDKCSSDFEENEFVLERLSLRFVDCEISNSIFSGINLRHSKFKRTSVINCTFSCNLLSTSEFRMSRFINVTFKECDFEYSSFSFSVLARSSFISSNLNRVDFQYSSLNHMNSEKSNFFHSIFIFSYVTLSKFTDCKLRYIEFRNSAWDSSRIYEDSKPVNLDNTNRIENLDIGTDIMHTPPTDKSFVSVSNIGSRYDTTYYDYKNDIVICGCWGTDDDMLPRGGSLADFEERVKFFYPDGRFHDEYMNAIKIFKYARESYLASVNGNTED